MIAPSIIRMNDEQESIQKILMMFASNIVPTNIFPKIMHNFLQTITPNIVVMNETISSISSYELSLEADSARFKERLDSKFFFCRFTLHYCVGIY